MAWSTKDIADLSGKTAVITGITGGLGTAVARELAHHGAVVIGTARNSEAGKRTAAEIREKLPSADINVIALDLADLNSVVASASQLRDQTDRIDVLINNAGIMIPPSLRTADGFELQIGTNHLGHFAWTATLWPLLNDSAARVVSVSSIAHASVSSFDLRSLTSEGSLRRYRRWTSYGESKLANLLFMRELQRRATAAGSAVISVAAHPGIAATNLTKTGLSSGGSSFPGNLIHAVSPLIAQPAHAGAWPLLRAATEPGVTGGEYFGPTGFRQVRGRPGPVGMTRLARDTELASAVWSASQAATGVRFDFDADE